MKLDGRMALVTGGARGIGREITLGLLARGCRVGIAGRDAAALDAMAAAHGRVTALPADLSTPGGAASLAARAAEALPTLSLIVNNAAVQNEAWFLDGAADLMAQAEADMRLNVLSPAALIAALAPGMAARGAGAVVNVTTGLIVAPKTDAPIYCASKAALHSLTRSLRYQFEDGAPQLRAIEAIMPMVDTDMTAGRGVGKISAEQAAETLLRGVEAGCDEIWIGKARLLPLLSRLSPELVARMLR